MICTRCGKANVDTAKFCAGCGSPLQAFHPERSHTPDAGFLRSLFDFSFTYFITTKIIKFVYILGMLITGLIAIFIMVMGFNTPATGIQSSLLAVLVFLLFVIFGRILMELIIVVFRMAEHIRDIANAIREERRLP